MVACTINGFTLPVADDSWSDSVIEIAERGRAVSGAYLGTRRAIKRTFSGAIISTVPADVEAYRCVINGEGYGWSFASDLRDDWKGNQGWSTTYAVREAGGKYSAGQMSVTAAQSTVFTFPTSFPGLRWSISLYRKNGSAWEHWAAKYGTATVWQDGTAGVTKPSWLTLGTTSVTLTGDAGAAAKYSEIHLWPFKFPDTWPATISARTTAMAKPPFVAVAGDYVVLDGTTSYTCRGMALTSAATNRGALDRLQRVDFTLEES